ncbi:Hypothetical predicted protein [Paramuricea clavata]|uniref:Uncharacterized protein n=1 Tax=Paramuricea clavata TaxID=317549 RepID=A0A7D9E001_PARCT|nr:Hypothetical predicted protein [Paramuricea clavata]
MRKKVLVYVSLSLFAAWAILVTTFHLIFPRRLPELFYLYLFVISFGLVYNVAVYVKIFSVSRKATTFHGENAQSRNSQLQNGLSVVEKKGETAGTSMDLNTADNNNNHNGEITAPTYTDTPCQKMRKKTYNAVQKFKLTAKEKKTIFRMLCIIGVLYFTSIPILAAFTYVIVRGTDGVYVNYLFPWGVTMTFSSGVINAYIYCYRNEHFRTRKPTFKSSPVCSSGNANDSHAGQSRSQQNSTKK